MFDTKNPSSLEYLKYLIHFLFFMELFDLNLSHFNYNETKEIYKSKRSFD